MTINMEKNSILNDIHSKLKQNFEEMISWRRHMHQYPELSFKEEDTAEFIKGKLQEFGLKIRTNIGGNGLIGILEGSKPGKTIALRADFDALPIDDQKDVPYKSLNPGVMHACGHDGHTAALLGTAQALSMYHHQMNGTILFVFQPAEETPPGGAKFMIEENVLDGVDYVFAAHLASEIPLGKVALGSGHKMAAVDKFKIVINGTGGHGARPHESNDPIVIGSDIVNALQKVVSRRIDPLKPAVVTFGVFQAGNAFNVIPDTAQLEGTVRTFDKNVRQQVKSQIHTIVNGVASGFGAKADIDYLLGYPALFNHDTETETVKKLFFETFAENDVIELETGMGAEDFSYFLLEKPGTYFRVGSQSKDEKTKFPHHHPNFDIDERALLNIEKAFTKIISHYLF